MGLASEKVILLYSEILIGNQNLCLFEITKILNPPVELHHYVNLQVANKRNRCVFGNWDEPKHGHLRNLTMSFSFPKFLAFIFSSAKPSPLQNLVVRCTRGRWSRWRDDRIAWIYGWGGLVEWNDWRGTVAKKTCFMNKRSCIMKIVLKCFEICRC